MASFFSDLWDSIFTPGTTPTLLIATNVTFGALQLVLALLLVATQSIHFVILSVLSGGLWWGINWFARELKIHQQQEEEKDLHAQGTDLVQGGVTSGDSETEVEGRAVADRRRGRARPGVAGESSGATKATSASNEVEVVKNQGELKQRGQVRDESLSQSIKSSVSTEDEWEKVSGNENEKDK